jgi:hypothetical protein
MTTLYHEQDVVNAGDWMLGEDVPGKGLICEGEKPPA